MSTEACRFLRPFLHRSIQPRANASYARFFSACSTVCAKKAPSTSGKTPGTTGDYEKRIALLNTYTSLDHSYPRLSNADHHGARTSVRRLREKSEALENGGTDHGIKVTVSGTTAWRKKQRTCAYFSRKSTLGSHIRLEACLCRSGRRWEHCTDHIQLWRA